MTGPDTTPIDPTRLDEGQLEAASLIDWEAAIRRRLIHAGVTLGVFDTVPHSPVPAEQVITELDLDPEYGYRFLRSLANYDVMEEHPDRRFSLTPIGEYFRTDHPRSLRGAVLHGARQENRLVWQHFPDIVKEGGPNGMVREFGCDLWEYHERNPEVAATFNAFMTASSQMLAPLILDALSEDDLDGASTVCDVGGGHGYLLAAILRAYPHLEGCVLELPDVVEEAEAHWAPKVGVEDRCEYVAGDMFEEVPEADAYVLKWILHDWDDEECIEILSTIHDCAATGARLFICETIVPGPDTSHTSKARDADIMVWLDSRERTRAEWENLIEAGGWDLMDIRGPDEGPISVLEARRP